MIDIKGLRDDIENVENALARRGYVLDKKKFINLDAERKLLQTEVEALQSDRKNLSNDFGKLKANNSDTTELKKKIDLINEDLKNKNEALNVILSSMNDFMLDIPNIPHPSSPDGINEKQNIVIRTIGEITSTNTIDHIDITKKIDTDLAAKIAGARFSVLSGDMAKLQRCLITFMLDIASKNGYKEYYLPLMANVDSLTATGNLPKFEEDLFKTTESLYLIPTAEVPLTNIYRNELISSQDVPLKLTAHTSCFRSEAGSYGKDTKGLIRQHQFEKIELVQVTQPETSLDDLYGLLDNAEEILKLLELPYQVIELCAGDLGFSSCKTFDIEVWLPSQSKYREISSCSNFSDFQSRRANIKINTPEGKILAHTINGSALAVGRALIAVIENNYDGKDSIELPQVLHDYFGASSISI
ncbi:serine--tRNA ligase [Gammaproteobacteria bacterium]|jgi:seryl-tRNA synthetase|nr:serine--tRNA ligase [Gammaproteobacteria bacterium]MDA9947081.1 serine--tRNA ligase [bacterium]MDB2611433.1 serine--tRNA ligase [Gammaproteobacteria bacterium]